MELQNENLEILATKIHQLITNMADKIQKREETTDIKVCKKLDREIKEDHERVVLCIEVMSDITSINQGNNHSI